MIQAREIVAISRRRGPRILLPDLFTMRKWKSVSRMKGANK